MCRDTAWFLCDRSSAIALMGALVMTLSCYGALEIVRVLLFIIINADLRFISPQPQSSQSWKTTDKRLVNRRVVCSFTPRLSLVLINWARRDGCMARLVGVGAQLRQGRFEPATLHATTLLTLNVQGLTVVIKSTAWWHTQLCRWLSRLMRIIIWGSLTTTLVCQPSVFPTWRKRPQNQALLSFAVDKRQFSGAIWKKPTSYVWYIPKTTQIPPIFWFHLFMLH